MNIISVSSKVGCLESSFNNTIMIETNFIPNNRGKIVGSDGVITNQKLIINGNGTKTVIELYQDHFSPQVLRRIADEIEVNRQAAESLVKLSN